MSDRFFCAAESRSRGESIYGTVAQILSWVLLEYPSAWRRHAIEDSHLLPDAVKAHLRNAADRTLLIRQEHCLSERIRCYFVHSSIDSPGMTEAQLSSYDDLPGLPAGEPVSGPMYAVCTHGRHDKCCAKFGIPVSCAFRDLAGDRAWQCSHVGGDRFAGNVVVFPYGIYYGRAAPEDVPEIIRRTEAGEVWLPGYRGRSCFPRAIQVAEYFARRESGRLGIGEFRPIDRIVLPSGATRVRLESRSDGGVHLVEFATRTDRLQRLTCGADDESPVPQYDLIRYEVGRIQQPTTE